MADPAQYFFERSNFEDVCDDCGDWGFLISICDFGTGRRLYEKCESCFQRWMLQTLPGMEAS